jgi:hypothetical protein
VVVDGAVVIAKGAPASGTVQQVNKAGRANKSVLNFTVDYVTAVDGSKLRLKPTNISENSGGSALRSMTFGWVKKQKDLEYAKGAEVRGVIDGDKEVKAAKSAKDLTASSK